MVRKSSLKKKRQQKLSELLTKVHVIANNMNKGASVTQELKLTLTTFIQYCNKSPVLFPVLKSATPTKGVLVLDHNHYVYADVASITKRAWE